jgi:hypothetical protein
MHAFQALRRMDEIMVANFHVFLDLVADEPYYLWVADEGWEIDHFLFDNPELRRTPYAWLSDFVGMLPMPDGGAAEAALTADVNAEHVERIRRFSRPAPTSAESAPRSGHRERTPSRSAGSAPCAANAATTS